MIPLSFRSIVLLFVFAVTWTFSFVLTILALQRIPYATLTALRVLVALIFLLPFVAKSAFGLLKLKRSDWFDFSLLALFGVILAQLFQVMYRYSYAPPATDVSFLLSLAPVFILLLSALVLSERITFAKIMGTAAAVLGMVSILANWERPSTFSPFSRYPQEETFILLAAFCWALFTVHARRVVKKHDPLVSTFATLGIGFIPLLILALVRDGFGAAFKIEPTGWLTLLLLGIISTAVSYLLWFQSLEKTEAAQAGAVLFLTPVLLSSLVGIERRIGFFGTNPMVMAPVVIGSLLTLLGVYVVWAKWMENRKVAESQLETSSHNGWLQRALIFSAAGSLLLGAAAFFLPVRMNYVKGILLNEALYESQWQTVAYETVGGFLFLLVGIVNFVSARRYLRGGYGLPQLLGWAVFSAVLLSGGYLAGNTVFFAWVPWIPAEILHAIGTEYVRIWEAPVRNVPMILSISASILFLLVVLIIAILGKMKDRKKSEVSRFASQ